MTLMLLIAAGALPAVALDRAPSSPDTKCPRTTSYHAFDRSKTVKPQKLNELPPANAYSAVYRTVGGCEIPVVVRYDIGSGR